ncbi:hypothetical protein ACIGDI_41845 [Streptomyces sp. NPDC085900]|uniref:hypothetical protein n=1 Tax=Streptomyces sp. NPDC085900 TaxID=3365737 RepID=UPI0037D7BE5C
MTGDMGDRGSCHDDATGSKPLPDAACGGDPGAGGPLVVKFHQRDDEGLQPRPGQGVQQHPGDVADRQLVDPDVEFHFARGPGHETALRLQVLVDALARSPVVDGEEGQGCLVEQPALLGASDVGHVDRLGLGGEDIQCPGPAHEEFEEDPGSPPVTGSISDYRPDDHALTDQNPAPGVWTDDIELPDTDAPLLGENARIRLTVTPWA